MAKNPLLEVFGFPVSNLSVQAENYRHGRLCPYHNSSGLNCTKSSATDPIGVCSIKDGDDLVITCPVRFREDFKIVTDAANFFFPNQKYVAITEARLKDKYAKSAGNIDIVIAALDENNKVIDFGAVEVQAVYISGNVKNVFLKYMQEPAVNYAMSWPPKNYPTPDYLSSLQTGLAPQLIYEGGIFHAWKKKIVVVVDESFFKQLPKLKRATKQKADIAWLVYGLRIDKQQKKYVLEQRSVIYTFFESALATLTNPDVGQMADFVDYLQNLIDKGKTTNMPDPSPLLPEVEPMPNFFSGKA